MPVTFMAAAGIMLEEDKDADVANTATTIDEGANGYSASLALWSKWCLFLAAGYDNNIQISKTDSAWRLLAGSLDMGKMNMGWTL